MKKRHTKYLLPFPMVTIGLLIASALYCSKPKPPEHPGYEPPPEYAAGVPIADFGLELKSMCDPIQITEGKFNKRIPAIGVSGGDQHEEPYQVHVIWSEPVDGTREIFQSVGFLDECRFTLKSQITESDGAKSFNPVVFSDRGRMMLAYMDESVNTREIWVTYGDYYRWDEPELLTDPEIDSRSWGALPMRFLYPPTGWDWPLLIWFDHRYEKHEILMKSHYENWTADIRITDDGWFQFDPHAEISTGYSEPVGGTVHLVYMDSRYTSQVDKHSQHEGNTEIFYRILTPMFNNQDQSMEWDIGVEIQLSFSEGVSDLPRVCGMRFSGNKTLDSAGVVWHEIDMEKGTGEIHYADVTSGNRGKLKRLSPPDRTTLNPDIVSIPIEGHENLRVVAYQMYEEGEEFPLGVSNIYIRLIDGEKISDPIQISDSEYVCSYPRMCVPGINAEGERTLLIAWSEYRGGKPGFGGESQIFFRSFEISANDLITEDEMDYN